MAHRARFFAIWRGRGIPTSENYTLTDLPSGASIQSVQSERSNEKKKRSVLKVLQAPRRSERRVKMILLRDVLMLINGMTGLFVAIALLELSWNGTDLKNTWGDQAAKYFLTVSTVILVMQVIEYNVMIIYMRMKDMKHASADRSMMRIKNPTFLMVWNNSSIKWKFWFELLAVLPHPFPGIGTTFDKVGTLLMFGRLFILVKVLRDLSPVWNAKAMPNIPGYSHAIQPTFTAWRAFKAYFYGYPVTCVTVLLVLLCIVTTYAIYIFEREEQPAFTFAICFYITLTSMFLGWPSDVFNVYNAVTWGAKIISIIASVVGIFLFALLIDYLHSVMQLSYNEKFIYDWLNKRSYDDKIRDEAAKLIQTVWKHYQWKKHKDEVFKDSGISSFDKRRLTKKERKAFNAKLVQTMKGFQQARRRKFMRFGADDPSLHPGAASAPPSTGSFWEFTRPSSPAPKQDPEKLPQTPAMDTLSGGVGSSQPSINGDGGSAGGGGGSSAGGSAGSAGGGSVVTSTTPANSSAAARSAVRVLAKRRPIRQQSFITPSNYHAHHNEPPAAFLQAHDQKVMNDIINDRVEQMRREMIEDMKYLLQKQKEDILDELRRSAMVAGQSSSFGDLPHHPHPTMHEDGHRPDRSLDDHPSENTFTESLMFAPAMQERATPSPSRISPTFPSRLTLPIERKREKGKEKEREDDDGGEVEIIIDKNMDLLG